MEGFIDSEFFSKLYHEMDVKSKEDAITRPFFIGVAKFDKNWKYMQIVPPAFTENNIKLRLNDPKFCKHCLLYQQHDIMCRITWKQDLDGKI